MIALLSTTRGVLLRASRLATGTALGLGMALSIAIAPAFAQAALATAPTAIPANVMPAPGAGPALWVVKDADSTLYLFGTVHVLRPTTPWGTAKVDTAFNSASEVWFEVSNPEDQAALMPLIQKHGLSPDRPLSSLLTAEEIALLDAAAGTIGATAAQLDPFRPWLAGLTLSVAPLAKAGYDPASGVEMVFKARALADGKAVRAFETLDKQVSIMAALSEASQVESLRIALKDFENATTDLDQLVNAWAVGDIETIDRIGVKEMKASSAEMYQALLVDRNTDWANQIQTLLGGSGTAFIAVGAAHLVGDDSVQSILEDRGVAVTRE